MVGGDDCFRRGVSQTFCFTATSCTTDWDYVYYLWLRFPADWVVSGAYIHDTPYCIYGGTFGPFSWYIPPDRLNEIEIEHIRYHANPTDTCMAYYCVQVTTGSLPPGMDSARVSWYWRSSEYGSAPYYPCSTDGYTPSGWPACDQASTAPAYIDRCPGARIYLPVVFKNSP